MRQQQGPGSDLVALLYQLLELGLPVGEVLQLGDGPQGPFGNRRAGDHLGHGQEVLMVLPPEKLDRPGCPGLPRGVELTPGRRDGAQDPVGGHPARQGADGAVLEGPIEPEGDLDGLFAVGGRLRRSSLT